MGRAIALDPNDSEALRILVDLIGEQPETPPAEVADELERAGDRSRIQGLRRAVLFYTVPLFLFFLPAAVLMDPKSVAPVALWVGSFFLTALTAALCSWRPDGRALFERRRHRRRRRQRRGGTIERRRRRSRRVHHLGRGRSGPR